MLYPERMKGYLKMFRWPFAYAKWLAFYCANANCRSNCSTIVD